MADHPPPADPLLSQLARAEVQMHNAVNNYAAAMRILECAEINIDDRLQVNFLRNGEQIFGDLVPPCAVVDLFEDSAEASRYFEWMFDVREVMRAQAKAAEQMPWETVFPSPRRKDDSLLRFKPVPAGDWDLAPQAAQSRPASNSLGQYLMSPKQLIAADQDFRIEYTGVAGPDCSDLSAVVGGECDERIFLQTQRVPEDHGYCFGFGCYHNTRTQLQRFRREMVGVPRTIQAGRSYRLAAERVGGRLRFYIDGEIAYEYIDILPLLGAGHGWVGLYSWGAGQHFSDVQVCSRPTCLSLEQRRQIESYRAPILKVKGNNARWVELRLVGSRQGTQRTVYQVMVRDSSVAMSESQRRIEAERASTFDAERLAVTLRSIGDGIITTDVQSRVTLMNRAAEILTGWSQDEAIGLPLTKVFHIIKEGMDPPPDPRIAPVKPENKASVIIGRDDYITMIARDGTRRIIAKSGSSIMDPKGRVLGTVLVFRDITAQHKAEEARAQLAAIVESSEDAIIGKSLDGRIVSWNAGAERILGYTAAEVIGRSGDFLLADGVPRDITDVTQRVAADQTFEHYETVYKTRDGTALAVALTKSVIKNTLGELIGVSTICRDITERKRTEAALRESEERYALAARGANDGLWDWNLKTDEVYFSDRFREMLGLAATELPPRFDAWLARIHPEDQAEFRGRIEAHRAGHSPHLEAEHRVRHQDGEFRWMLVRGLAVADERGRPSRIAGSLTDITDRKRAEDQFRHDALHDQLTGLPNRALFADRLSHALQRLKRHRDYRFAVMFLDLDRFKVVNDSLGHLVGDRLLIEIAQRLRQILRPVDTVGRLGGDEFTVLLDGLHDTPDAEFVAGRILKDLQQPFRLQGREIFISVSIGIVMSTPRYERAEELLRDADTAMYRAKSLGKSRFEKFDNSMHEKAVERLQLETDLRKALERDELELYFQPVYDLNVGKLAGVEAEVAWRHPQRGLLFSPDFRAVADETGLILPIYSWALRAALRRWSDWRRRHPAALRFRLGIELAPQAFEQDTLTDDLQSMLKDTGLTPGCLRLSVPEATLVDNFPLALERLSQLQTVGLELCICRFGAGHSSLGALHQLPVQFLKIHPDGPPMPPPATGVATTGGSGARPAAGAGSSSTIRALKTLSKGSSAAVPAVSGPGASSSSTARALSVAQIQAAAAQRSEFLQLVGDLAQRLQIQILAETVTNHDQIVRLQQYGCHLATGPWFSPPQPAAEMENTLAQDTVLALTR